MLLLTSVSDKIQVITGTAGASVDVHASWVDNNAGTITPGRLNTVGIATAATTDVVPAPGASVQRNVKGLYITNTFPFSKELAGATIATATVTSATLRGTDPAGADMVQGAAVIAGTDVKQRIKGMLNNVTYQLKAKVVDADGLVHVHKATVLVKG